MKKLGIKNCLLLVFLPFVAVAQVAVSSDGAHLLWASVDNPLTVAVSDVPDSNLQLIPSQGQLQRTGKGHYVWRICPYTTARATLIVRDTVAGEDLDTLPFGVRPLPDPTVLIPQKHTAWTGHVKEDVLLRNQLALVFENLDYDVRAEVVSYELLVVAGDTREGRIFHNSGPNFSPELRSQIAATRPGDTLVFQNVRCQMPCEAFRRRLDQQILLTIW